MKKTDPVDVRSLREKLCAALFDGTTHGSARRAILVPLLLQYQTEQSNGLRVNSRGCPLMEKDSDLTYLVDHGAAKLGRIPQSGRTSYTYLQLTNLTSSV